MKNKVIFFSIVILFMYCTTSFAYEFSGTFKRWPSIQTKAVVNATIKGTPYVFVGDGDTINIYNAANLSYLSHVRIPMKNGEGIYSLTIYNKINEETLYAACGSGGIHIVDISEPTVPTTEGTSPITISNHVTEGDADNNETVSNINAFDIAILNDIMYVADNDYGIRLFMFSGGSASPRSPKDTNLVGFRTDEKLVRNIGVFEYSGSAYVVALTTTDIGYLKLSDNGRKIDANTFKSSTVAILAGLSTLSIDTLGYAYFTDQVSNNLLIYDIANAIIRSTDPIQIYPKKPLTSSEPYDDLNITHPRGFFITENETDANPKIYMTSYYGETEDDNADAGLNIINASDQYNPYLPASTDFALPYASSVSVRVDGASVSAYIMSTKSGLSMLNINENPITVTATQQTALNAKDVFVAYEYAFVADGLAGSDYGFSIINVDNPFHPYFEKFVKTPGQAHSVYIDPGYRTGFVADGTAGIQILTFSSQTGLVEPTILGAYDLGNPNLSAVKISGVDKKNYILTLIENTTDATLNEVWVSDFSTVSTSLPTVSINMANAVNVHAYSSYAFVSSGADGAGIIKIWDNDAVLAVPETISIIDAPGYTNVVDICTGSITDPDESEAIGSFSDDENGDQYAFVADAGSVHLIAINSDASNFSPKKTYTIDISSYGQAMDVEFSDNTLYIMTNNNDHAILIYDVTDVNNPVFKDSDNSYGTPSGLFIYNIVEVDDGSITGQQTIKAAFLAEGAGYLSIKDVQKDPSGTDDRVFTNGTDMLCFLSAISEKRIAGSKTMIIMSLLFSVIGFVFTLAAMIFYYKKRNSF